MSFGKIKTMEEFAKVSGISRPTLSKYFFDAESVKKNTRQRIEAALEEHDYRPNLFAINQNRKATRTIGILVPYLSDPVFAEFARNLERRCIDAGYRVALFSAHGEQDIETEALDALRALRPSGVLLSPLGRKSDVDSLAAFCEEVPTVLFDRNIEGIGAAFVGSDNESFVSQSVEYLTRTGEVPCFFEMKNPSNPNSIARRRTFISYMDQLGLEPNLVQVDGEGWDLEKIGYEGAIKAIDQGDLKSDTVLCSNDRLAFGLLAACYEKGLRVGRGPGCAMRVAAHDNHPFSRYTCPSLTTVGHEYDTIAECGVETLFKLIDQGGHLDSRSEQLFPARLTFRLSA